MNSCPLLLVDVGNSRVKWTVSAVGAKEPLRVQGSVDTSKMTPARIRALAGKFQRHHLILASVVPKLSPHFAKAFRGRFHQVDSSLSALGFQFHYPKPAELGADRLAVAAAIYAERLFPAIIIACGTATAFTVLDAKGRLCGGAIAPGLQTQMTALLGATAQLPATEVRLPRTALAKSTKEAIRAGVLFNFQGGIKEILAKLIEATPGKPRLILTGGNAEHVAPHPGLPCSLRPLLVLEGLRIIGNRMWSAGE